MKNMKTVMASNLNKKTSLLNASPWFAFSALLVTATTYAAEPPATAVASATPSIQQPPPPPPRGIALSLALEAAQTAIATCTANGYKVAASVVDSEGGLRLLLADDGAPQRGADSSTAKADTVITFKAASGEVAKRAESDTALAARIAADPKLRARAGGLPLIVGGTIIGAVGVGGAPGGEKDEACAAAGINKIKNRLK